MTILLYGFIMNDLYDCTIDCSFLFLLFRKWANLEDLMEWAVCTALCLKEEAFIKQLSNSKANNSSMSH